MTRAASIRIVSDVLLREKLAGSTLRKNKKYNSERISQIRAEIKNLFHLMDPVPFKVNLNVLLFNGLIRNVKATSAAIKGKIIKAKLVKGSIPRRVRSLGLAAKSLTTRGSETVLTAIARNTGKAPIVLATTITAASITR